MALWEEMAEIKYRCLRCRDAGWLVRRDAPVGSPEFGTLVRCNCRDDPDNPMADRHRYRAGSGLSRMLEDLTFERWEEREGAEQALEAATGFARRPHGWLLLVGPPGTGKTHLAAAIANRVLDQGARLRWWYVPDLLEWWRDGYAVADFGRRFKDTASVPVLVLDDLAVERPTDWVAEQLERLISHRYQEQLPTVITSNVGPRELADRLSARIASRLLDRELCCIAVLRCSDYRPRKRAAGGEAA